MILKKILKKGNYILGSFLLSSMFVACTNDYFVDENNYRIYVPEIQHRLIQDFYVAFHDAAGNHLRTRRFSGTEFNAPYITDGIIRSKLQVGEVNVMCFAQLGDIAVTKGKPLAESFLSLPAVDESKHIYATTHLNVRMYHKVKTVYPIGDPLAQLPDTISMNENCVYTGTINVNFKNLPTEIVRVDVWYSGLATRMNFDGVLDRFTDDDRVYVSYDVKGHGTSDFKQGSEFLPSAGTQIGTEAPTEGSSQENIPGLGIVVKFFNENGHQMGYLTETDLADTSPIVDGPGQKITRSKLLLKPRGIITFNFDKFTLWKISLSDWGGITPGETTPT